MTLTNYQSSLIYSILYDDGNNSNYASNTWYYEHALIWAFDDSTFSFANFKNFDYENIAFTSSDLETYIQPYFFLYGTISQASTNLSVDDIMNGIWTNCKFYYDPDYTTNACYIGNITVKGFSPTSSTNKQILINWLSSNLKNPITSSNSSDYIVQYNVNSISSILSNEISASSYTELTNYQTLLDNIVDSNLISLSNNTLFTSYYNGSYSYVNVTVNKNNYELIPEAIAINNNADTVTFGLRYYLGNNQYLTLNTNVIFSNWYTPNNIYNLASNYNQAISNNTVYKE